MAGEYRNLGLTIPVAEALDPELWIERYCRGLLTLDPATTTTVVRGVQALPASTVRWHLRAALSEAELKLGIKLGVQICKADPLDPGMVQGRDYDRRVGRLPFNKGETEQWYRIDLPNDLISVERIRAYYYGTLAWELSDIRNNSELIRIEWPRQGVMHIIPSNLNTMLVSLGGDYGIWWTLYNQRTPLPDFWAVDYTTGPVARDGSPGEIEVVIANWVACTAARPILALAGMVASKGVTASSLTMDGVSRSVSLASGSGGLYGAMADAYKEVNAQIDWKSLRVAKRGIKAWMY